MTKTLGTYFILILLSTVSCNPENANTSGDSDNLKGITDSTFSTFKKALLRQQIDSVLSTTGFNGGISVEQNGEKIYERFQGFENFKTKKELDSNSVFAIGSVSKQFTAAMILLLEDNGRLRTDDKVSEYLPEFQSKSHRDITISQLLNHTSGLSDFGKNLQSSPGAAFSYSNKGYRLLGEIIEKSSGKNLDQNAKELFVKAGLSNTYTADNFTGTQLAGAHTGTKSNSHAVPNMPERLAQKSISVTAGGILSTVPDLHRWNNAMYSGKILKPTSLKKLVERTSEMKHPILGKVGYGYGIMLGDRPASYLHSGYVKGAPALLIYYPVSKMSVVILSNIADTSKPKYDFFQPHKEVKGITDKFGLALNE